MRRVTAQPRTPAQTVFAILALLMPVLISGQVFLAGLAIFSDGSMRAFHGAMGGALALPILAMMGLAFLGPGLTSHRLPVTVLFVLYCLQFLFVIAGEGIGFIQALHPANAVTITVVAVLIARSVWAER